MSGPDHGPAGGLRGQERPASEGDSVLLESGPRISSGACESEVASYRLLCRHILVQAAHDMGTGTDLEIEEIHEFLETRWFEELCDYSNWEVDWVKRIFVSLDSISGPPRKEITKQMVHLMKVLSVKNLD